MKYSVVTCTGINVLATLMTTAATKMKRSDRRVKIEDDVECHQKMLSLLKIVGDLVDAEDHNVPAELHVLVA